MRMLPYRTQDNVIAGVVITFTDVTRISAAEERIDELTLDLRERLHSLETLLDLVPVGVLMMTDNRSGQIRINRFGASLLGENRGDGALDAVVPTFRMNVNDREVPRQDQPLQMAARTGEPVSSFEGEVLRADGSRFHALISATPLIGEDGRVRGGIGAILDISARKRAEAQQQVLLLELQHRVKNIITTISALATRMTRGAVSVPQFTEAFLGRLDSMARTHDLLTRSNWQGTDLKEMVANMLRAHLSGDGGNIRIDGPELTLEPSAATTLGMVFYELATNAAKYGALSTRAGRIDIQWRVSKLDGEEGVSLIWEESGGPAVKTDTAEGFGTAFVKRSVAYEISGHVRLELRPNGVHCLIEFPLRRNVQRANLG
jgi:two-component system CheB/CheR fusion protein